MNRVGIFGEELKLEVGKEKRKEFGVVKKVVY